ncbi:DMT family transporter [Bacillus dakarensis]|uniref:DMT family transporter n=1 Tax=Robertmurraya dakarensis TaxID=1926278 RepID=UPI000980C84A|nr:DMT family transporter [Bacillus dakarensis]
MKTQMYPYAAALLNAAIVGLSFLFTKLALQVSTPMDTLAYRFLFAWAGLTCFLFFSPKSFAIKVKGKRNILSLLAIALFYPTLFFSFQAFGLDLATSAEGGIIFAFGPALIALMAAYFLKEKTNKKQYAFIFLSIFGVLYIFFMKGFSINVDQPGHSLGILLLLLSCLSIASYTIMARYLSVSYSPIQLTYIMVTFGFIFFNGYAIVENIINGQLLAFLALFQNHVFVLSVGFLGILATMCTSFLSNYSLSKLSASQMGIFSNIATVISIAAGAVILHEPIYYYHIIGSVLIIIGVLGTNLSKERGVKRDTSMVHHSRTP